MYDPVCGIRSELCVKPLQQVEDKQNNCFIGSNLQKISLQLQESMEFTMACNVNNITSVFTEE